MDTLRTKYQAEIARARKLQDENAVLTRRNAVLTKESESHNAEVCRITQPCAILLCGRAVCGRGANAHAHGGLRFFTPHA
ncbi:hypothetical protein EON67_00245 [archaeon]|nr:MAG: hypothetical protein EON67_00245 [archaeon]